MNLVEIYNRYKDFTLIDETSYLANLRLCQTRAPQGCIVECGVWKGGMLAGMADVLPGRTVHGFDSFLGLPPPRDVDGPAAMDFWRLNHIDNCKTDANFVRNLLARSAAREWFIHAGWLHSTLAEVKIDQPIAVLRLDVDWYDPTFACLLWLYHRVALGGLIIVDDYYVWDGCARAVHDFFITKPIRIRQFDNQVCYIVKD